MSGTCPECGEELDDYSACSCRLGAEHAPRRKPAARGFAVTMREMVERKLGRRPRTDR